MSLQTRRFARASDIDTTCAWRGAELARVSMVTRIDLLKEARDAYRAMAAFDRSVEFDPALRELVKIRASQINGCAYCVDMHTRAARRSRETEQRIYALAAWRESPLFSARERIALELTDAVTKVADGGVPDGLYRRAADEFSSGELANLILAISAINAWNRIAVSTAMVYGEPAGRDVSAEPVGPAADAACAAQGSTEGRA